MGLFSTSLMYSVVVIIFMQKQGKELLYLRIKRVVNLSGDRLGDGVLRVQVQNQRHSHSISLTGGQQQLIDSIHLCSCESDSIVRINAQFTQQQRKNHALVALNKLSAMPKVKHIMEVKLAQMKEGEVGLPVNNVVQVDMDLIYLPKFKGRLVISAIDLKLTRDTDLVGKLDPFIELEIGKQMYRTSVHVDQGLKGIWREVQSFLITDLANKGVLKLRVWDEDQTSDEIVGEVDINLALTDMCVPLDDPAWKEFTLYHDKVSAGTVMLEYMFVPLPL